MNHKAPSSPSRSTSTSMQGSIPVNNFADVCLIAFPRELHLNMLTFLRATDLSALQQTCHCFNNRALIAAVVGHAASEVYPSDLTVGFDTPIVSGEVTSLAVVSKKSSKKISDTKEIQTDDSAVGLSTEKIYTYEMLRNMEMLVVARVLSRPEPPLHERDTSFYVSKSWCRAALRWLEVQEEERKEKLERLRAAEEARAAAAAAAQCVSPPKGGGKGKHSHRRVPHPGSSGKKKPSRKEMRQKDRKMSDAMPPWTNINHDLACEHGDLKRCSSKFARARRRVMDKQAWKVLKRLYPDSIQLEANVGKEECLVCAAEAETARKADVDKKEEEKVERKKPLTCPLVRGFYTRGSKGYPINNFLTTPQQNMGEMEDSSRSSSSILPPLPLEQGSQCPLKAGVYCALPRSWCHRWRKYIKNGEGGMPPAPDASEVLCDAHNLPLVPPHLESFLLGETPSLLCCSVVNINTEDDIAPAPFASALSVSAQSTLSSSNAETLQALRAAGLSEMEVLSQRTAMMELEEARQRAIISSTNQARFEIETQDRTVSNEQLDRENRVVVEILTDEEVSALEKWWRNGGLGFYPLRFAVVYCPLQGRADFQSNTEILWSTAPCRECDPSSRSTTNFVLRNRLQKSDKKRGYR